MCSWVPRLFFLSTARLQIHEFLKVQEEKGEYSVFLSWAVCEDFLKVQVENGQYNIDLLL